MILYWTSLFLIFITICSLLMVISFRHDVLTTLVYLDETVPPWIKTQDPESDTTKQVKHELELDFERANKWHNITSQQKIWLSIATVFYTIMLIPYIYQIALPEDIVTTYNTFIGMIGSSIFISLIVTLQHRNELKIIKGYYDYHTKGIQNL